jgi:hypothetical protein
MNTYRVSVSNPLEGRVYTFKARSAFHAACFLKHWATVRIERVAS